MVWPLTAACNAPRLSTASSAPVAAEALIHNFGLSCWSEHEVARDVEPNCAGTTDAVWGFNLQCPY